MRLKTPTFVKSFCTASVKSCLVRDFLSLNGRYYFLTTTAWMTVGNYLIDEQKVKRQVQGISKHLSKFK